MIGVFNNILKYHMIVITQTLRVAIIIIYIVASHLRRGSVVTVAIGQINGGLSDCGQYPYPMQIHLIDTRILDLEWVATICYPLLNLKLQILQN